MGTKKTEIISKLKKFKERNGIEKMYLFGSVASGRMHRDSDIDLIIVSKKFRGKGALERSPPLYLKWNLDYHVDFLCYTPDEFNWQKAHITIVREAVKSGIEI